MLIYAGIDEAGYGPLLGPLCVAGTVFILRDADPADGPPDLWARLADGVCATRREASRRIAVADSKKLKGSPRARTIHPLHHLERGVLAFYAQGGQRAETDDDLFAALGCRVPRAHWYESSTPLPVAATANEGRLDARRIERTLLGAGVQLALMKCRMIDAPAVNSGVSRLGTKAAVNFHAITRLVQSTLSMFPGTHPRVIIDRQGGRTRYRQDLQLTWPEARIQVLAEESHVSRYRLRMGDDRLTISFETAAERKHFPVALASMIAKYCRELMMLRLNRYFTACVPDIQPTAGYVQDGRRFLDEIDDCMRERRLSRADLVRNR